MELFDDLAGGTSVVDAPLGHPTIRALCLTNNRRGVFLDTDPLDVLGNALGKLAVSVLDVSNN